jgi:hypothetical protein
MSATALLFLSFFVLLALGVPVAFALAAASLATIVYLGLPPLVLVIELAAGANASTLLAIPLLFSPARSCCAADCRIGSSRWRRAWSVICAVVWVR